MKILITLILTLIFNITLWGQNVKTYISETWTNGNWVNSTTGINTYDGNGNLTSCLGQTWDVPSSSWKNSSQMINTNNSNGTVNQSVYQSWDNTANNWTNSQQMSYTYDGSKNVLTSIGELWQSNSWQKISKSINTYNGYNYITNSLGQSWNAASTSWKNSSQMVNTNNTNGTVNQSIYQNWDNPTNSWKNLQRMTYTYVNSMRISEFDLSAIKIYPNPCSDFINVKLDHSSKTKISIIDLDGKTIISKFLDGNELSIWVKDFKPNIYIIRIESDKKIIMRKFIKQ